MILCCYYIVCFFKRAARYKIVSCINLCSICWKIVLNFCISTVLINFIYITLFGLINSRYVCHSFIINKEHFFKVTNIKIAGFQNVHINCFIILNLFNQRLTNLWIYSFIRSKIVTLVYLNFNIEDTLYYTVLLYIY